MRNLYYYIVFQSFFTFFFLQSIKAQYALICGNSPMVVVNSITGTCSSTPSLTTCNGHNFFSIALHKDTLYYIPSIGGLWRVKIDGTGCQQLVSAPFGGNVLTADNAGIIYSLNSAMQLISYSPYTNQVTTHGIVPFFPAGDMLFFNGKLLMSSIDQNIYEININNPSATTLFMATGQNFYGLMAFPENCGRIKYFGLQPGDGGTTFYELDLDNKIVVGPSCVIPIVVWDAASSVEHGIDSSLKFASIQFAQPCEPLTTTTIQAQVNFPNNSLIYTLDGGNPNNTGIFNNVGLGNHIIRVSTASGLCFKDSIIHITQTSLPRFNVLVFDDTCSQNTGNIAIVPTIASSNYSYGINGSNPNSTPHFLNLATGNYSLQVYNNGCRKDTTVRVDNILFNIPLQVQLQPATCGGSNGLIHITSLAGVLVSLNNNTPTHQTVFSNLSPGAYSVRLSYKGCQKDTTVIVSAIPVEPITKTVISNSPTCTQTKSGNIRINIAGSQAPYTIKYNGANFGSTLNLSQLTTGNYHFEVYNTHQCRIDSFTVHLVLQTDQNCEKIYIPSAFTPNGDRTNDELTAFIGPWIRNPVFRVFNRYGQVLYEHRGYYPKWNGFHKGKLQVPGTYVYQLQYETSDEKRKIAKGTIVLIN